MPSAADANDMREQFDRGMASAADERWDRFVWVHGQEERFGTIRWQIDPGTATLYYNATGSFVFGFYPASIAMIGAATERWLRWLVGTEPDLSTLIRKAVTQGKVSTSVAGLLERMRLLMRNPVAHGNDEVMKGILGWKPMVPHGWEAPEGYDALKGNLSAAKEGIETFLLLVQETIPDDAGKQS